MKSLLARLLLVVSVALVPALAFQAHTENEARLVRKQLVEEEALRLVRLVSAEQQRIVDGAEQVLDTISGFPAVRDNMAASCQQLLANVIHQSPRYNAVAVIGLDGHIRCAPFPVDPSIDLSDRVHFRLALQTGGTVIGDYVIGRVSAKPSIHVAKPFRDRDGVVAGVVDLALSLDWLQQQLEQLALPPASTAFIADRNGTILARRPFEARFIGMPILPENRFALEGHDVGVATMKGLDGNPLYVAYSPPGADAKGLLVKVGLNRDLTFAAMTQANWIGLLLIFLGTALALATTGVLGARLIGRPVKRLLAAAQRWEAGDFAARTGLRADRSEFGQLAAAFDSMAGAQEARERALQRSEQLFRATFEQAAVGMSQVVLDGTWLRVNDKLCAITGYTRDELLALTVQDITYPDDLEAARVQAKALVAGDIEIHTMEKRYLRKDGGIIWVNLTASLLRDAEEKPERLIAIIEDITTRKHAEMALRESETRLQLAREAAGFGISDWDLVTNTAVWSEEKWRQLGREPQPGSLDRESWIACLHPEDRERVLGELTAAFVAPTGSYDTEYRVVWPDGTVRWQLVKGKAFRGAGGQAERLICLSMDVTERRELEAALRQAQRLDALGRLTGGVAHDFNNLLSVITLSAESLISEDEADTEAAKNILDAARLGADLVHRLLAFSRRQPLHVQVLSFNGLVKDAVALLRRTLCKSIYVDLNLASDLWASEVDSSQLQDALLNLAINARDAMPDGGRLLIATANLVLEPDAAAAADVPPGDYVALSVADTGVGMTREVLEHALEPFFTTKALGSGTGLGLPMTYGFARQSGGHLTIESTPGAGTTVRLLLPRARDNATPMIPATVPGPAQRGRGRILLVDDNDGLRNVAVRQLMSLGYDVYPAENGPAALAVLRDGERFDLLFTDEVMPEGMSGTQLAQIACTIQPELKVLFTSGYHHQAAPHPGIEPRHMLPKPYRRAHLAAKIQEVIAD